MNAEEAALQAGSSQTSTSLNVGVISWIFHHRILHATSEIQAAQESPAMSASVTA